MSSTRLVSYVWKIPKPLDDVAARALMAAAYKTATAMDPNAKTILIRKVT